WYEAYADWEVVADRCERLVAHVARTVGVSGFEPPWRRVTLAAAIAERTGIDVFAHRSLDALRAALRERGLEVPDEDTWPQLVDHLLSRHVEPALERP